MWNVDTSLKYLVHNKKVHFEAKEMDATRVYAVKRKHEKVYEKENTIARAALK